MNEGELGVLMIIVILVGSFVSLFALKKYAQKVYNRTGYNALSGLNKFLSAVGGTAFIFFVISLFAAPARDRLTIFLITAVPLSILIINNLKAKNTASIVILTLLQMVSGFFSVLLLAFKFTLKMIGIQLEWLKMDINTSGEINREIAEQREKMEQDAREREKLDKEAALATELEEQREMEYAYDQSRIGNHK